jgi:hypothetical protein
VINLFLIAHKVRDEPAFDIAQHMTCPKCEGTDDHCTACDGVGHWWIIPTSGHRAFPYWNKPLLDHYISLLPDGNWAWTESQEGMVSGLMPDMPPSLRDHYTTEREAAIDLIRVLGLIHKPLAPIAPLKRRF